MKNIYCGTLLRQGIKSVSNRQRKQIRAVQDEIGQEVLGGYGQDTVEKWCQGYIPHNFTLHAPKLVRYCVTYGFVNRLWAQSFLTQTRYMDQRALLDELFPEKPAYRIFICYAGNIEPDRSIAHRLSQTLSKHHHVFFDQAREISPEWMRHITEELTQANFVIALLSSHSMSDEVVLFELEQIYRLNQQQPGTPLLLSFCLNRPASFPEPLNSYLDYSAQLSVWHSSEDIQQLIDRVEQTISGNHLPVGKMDKSSPPSLSSPPLPPLPLPLATHLSLEMPEGSISPQSLFYIERAADQMAHQAIAQQGVTMTIKGPRQTGKSSLLARLVLAAQNAGKQTIFLNFQQLQPAQNDADSFFRLFCSTIAYYLDKNNWETRENQLAICWRLPLPVTLRCSEYISQYLLTDPHPPLFLVMDEADTIFNTHFRNNFFGMLRSWHNGRALEPIWKQLDLILATSTEPYSFINDINQSPFNVGAVITLSNFTASQVAELNHRYQTPLNEYQIAQLMALLNGHPYLVHRALYLLACHDITPDALFRRGADDDGPFADHLRRHLLNLHLNPQLAEGLQQVLRQNNCPDKQIFWRLHAMGLVRQEQQTVVTSSCQLYAHFFERYFHV